MENIQDYILQTKSAVQKIYEAYNSYSELMQIPERPAFFFWGDSESEENKIAYEKWQIKNHEVLEERRKRDDEFAFEFFARSTLCGSILQFAFKAIELFSEGNDIPLGLENLVKKYQAMKFCTGRIVDNLPIGLIIYAGRNQSMHFNNLKNELNIEIFKRLSLWYSERFDKWFIDSYYDLENKALIHYSENILYKLDWISYERYENDLSNMLKEVI